MPADTPAIHSTCCTVYFHEQELGGQITKDCSAGCRSVDSVRVYRGTTAGFGFVTRPCGIVLGLVCLRGAESLSQMLAFVHRIFAAAATPASQLKFLGYDRACQLHPHIVNAAAQGNTAALEFQRWGTTCFVDRFHVRKHTTPECDITKPQCRYHPDLFPALEGVNSMMAETISKALNRFKLVIRNTNPTFSTFILYEVFETRNRHLASKLPPIARANPVVANPPSTHPSPNHS